MVCSVLQTNTCCCALNCLRCFFCLRRALSEDFLQHNGSPNSVAAPVTAVAACEEERGQLAAAATGVAQYPQQPEGVLPGSAAAAAGQDELGDAGGAAVLRACSSGDGDAAACLPSSQLQGPCGGGVNGAGLGSSPSRRGGIPQPPGSRAQQVGGQAGTPLSLPRPSPLHGLGPQQQMLLQQLQMQHQQQQGQHQQLPGTPMTPSSATPTAFGSALHKVSGSGVGGSFLRSASIDSDNPSLGFGAREVLQHLRWGISRG